MKLQRASAAQWGDLASLLVTGYAGGAVISTVSHGAVMRLASCTVACYGNQGGHFGVRRG